MRYMRLLAISALAVSCNTIPLSKHVGNTPGGKEIQALQPLEALEEVEKIRQFGFRTLGFKASNHYSQYNTGKPVDKAYLVVVTKPTVIPENLDNQIRLGRTWPHVGECGHFFRTDNESESNQNDFSRIETTYQRQGFDTYFISTSEFDSDNGIQITPEFLEEDIVTKTNQIYFQLCSASLPELPDKISQSFCEMASLLGTERYFFENNASTNFVENRESWIDEVNLTFDRLNQIYNSDASLQDKLTARQPVLEQASKTFGEEVNNAKIGKWFQSTQHYWFMEAFHDSHGTVKRTMEAFENCPNDEKEALKHIIDNWGENRSLSLTEFLRINHYMNNLDIQTSSCIKGLELPGFYADNVKEKKAKDKKALELQRKLRQRRR
jgi:hypothetical protein